MTSIKNVTVLGTGVLGAQIAYQASYAGFAVTAYDINDDVLARAAKTFDGLVTTYDQQVEGAAGGKAAEARARLTLSSDLAAAVGAADLVIEAIPEKLELKRSVFADVGKAAPASAILATNTSTLLPSQIMDATGRPERFLALHFANMLWVNNTAEIMGTAKTDKAVYDEVVDYATAMGMVPIEVKKEKAGYLLNSLLVPFLAAAAELFVDEIAEPEMVDKAWKVSTGAPMGPFQIIDLVGLNTVYNIASANPDPVQQRWAKVLKEQYIDKGRTGLAAGAGIYEYPKK